MDADLFAHLQWLAADVCCRFVQRPRQLLVQLHVGPDPGGTWFPFWSSVVRPGADQFAVFGGALLYVSVLRGDITCRDIADARAIIASEAGRQ